MEKEEENDYISKVTLEFLMNKEQYAKYLNHINIQKVHSNKKDKKFYRKRILDLTKQLLYNEKPEYLMPDVKNGFDMYINSCIDYFKILDKTDIIQEEYVHLLSDLNIDSKNEINIDDIGNVNDANQMMMRSIHITNPPTLLTNFVKIKYKKQENPPIIPMQKDINLKDPILKMKGISKKNIANHETVINETVINETVIN